MLKPSKFDINGRMPDLAVFVTDEPHISHWAAYIRDGKSVDLYLYEVTVSDSAVIEEGCDGQQGGDWKVLTNEALQCSFVRTV